MSDTERAAKRRDAFTLSMVDLFGCGFIAATFLFIFNMLQPQIDQADRGLTRVALAGSGGSGEAGPVIISIKSNQALSNQSEAALESGGNYFYESVLPDSSSMDWPHRVPIELPPAANTAEADVEVRLTLGSETIVANVDGWAEPSVLDILFSATDGLEARLDREQAFTFEVLLEPRQAGNGAYVSRFLFSSASAREAAVTWTGRVDRAEGELTGSGPFGTDIADPDANCTLVADRAGIVQFCGLSAADGLASPSDQLSQSAGQILPSKCSLRELFGVDCSVPLEDICKAARFSYCAVLGARQ